MMRGAITPLYFYIGGDNMANICSNYIKIQGDPTLIDIVAQDYIGYNKEQDIVEFNFGLMLPIPKELNGDDYWWRVENWGNKWDGSDAYIDLCDDEIFLTIDTAWGPCDKWTYELIRLCPGLNIYHEFQEGGEGFVGWIEHDESQDPEDYEEVCYNYNDEPFNYWVTIFEKEYETYDWLYEHVDWKLEDEEITEEIHDEIIAMIDGDAPLETLISRCIDEEIL